MQYLVLTYSSNETPCIKSLARGFRTDSKCTPFKLLFVAVSTGLLDFSWEPKNCWGIFELKDFNCLKVDCNVFGAQVSSLTVGSVL